MHLETRLVQLDSAINMELWQVMWHEVFAIKFSWLVHIFTDAKLHSADKLMCIFASSVAMVTMFVFLWCQSEAYSIDVIGYQK